MLGSQKLAPGWTVNLFLLPLANTFTLGTGIYFYSYKWLQIETLRSDVENMWTCSSPL